MTDMRVIPLLVRASTYLTNPKLRPEEILKSDESCIGEQIPLLAEEGNDDSVKISSDFKLPLMPS